MRLALTALLPLALAACGSPEDATTENAGMLPIDNAAANDVALPPDEAATANVAATNETLGNTAAAAPAAGDDPFSGRWKGVEGTYATITQETPGRYSVDMQYTLDEKGTFKASREGDTLVLQRGGQNVTMRRGTGDETGMKWLAGKQDCLVVQVSSEGYCRD